MLLQILQILVKLTILSFSIYTISSSYLPSSSMIEKIFRSKSPKNVSILPGSLESSKQYIKTRLARRNIFASSTADQHDDQPDPGPLGGPDGVRIRCKNCICLVFRYFL
jgi:hypothetical protein